MDSEPNLKRARHQTVELPVAGDKFMEIMKYTVRVVDWTMNMNMKTTMK